ncbi:unnamed protein product [Pieris macdunnoughi]|uniref:DDE Tnp4 domain-containing protein n=1 Tax=Pieris macdunnoughi TaxID=345717 RepID=A0A821XS88_9NEOP|nr:unnamed protein product [Pieris macdunnoughi]
MLKTFDQADEETFENSYRVSRCTFYELHSLIEPYIRKQDTNYRNSISSRERLAVCLKYLATGQSFTTMGENFRIGLKSVSRIVEEIPGNETEWKEIAEEFETKWNFSHCVGSCDGKHIAIEKPHESGPFFYNYKGFFSIVLFAVVNANYEFMYVHTGTNGSVADGAILKCTKFHKKMINNSLNLPCPSPLPGTDEIVPYMFLGDSAFALNKNFMKPFPFKNINRMQRIFKYRLSRAKRVVENAFGILSSRFRVLRRPLVLDLENVDAVVLACCALHNFLRKRVPTYICHSNIDSENIRQGTFREGDWIQTSAPLVSLQRSSTRQRNEDGNIVRNKFMDYFNSVGPVSFQDRMIDVVPP